MSDFKMNDEAQDTLSEFLLGTVKMKSTFK